jgi:hypothetical protein
MSKETRPTPLGILLAAMHAQWEAGDVKAAAALARAAAPYFHSRRGSVPHQAESGFDAERLTDAELEALLGAARGSPGTQAQGSDQGEPD